MRSSNTGAAPASTPKCGRPFRSRRHSQRQRRHAPHAPRQRAARDRLARRGHLDGSKLLTVGPLTDRSWTRQLPPRCNGKWQTAWPARSSRTAQDSWSARPHRRCIHRSFLVVRPTGASPDRKFGEWCQSEMKRAFREWRREFRGDAQRQRRPGRHRRRHRRPQPRSSGATRQQSASSPASPTDCPSPGRRSPQSRTSS